MIRKIDFRSRKSLVWIAVICAVLVVGGLVACAPGKNQGIPVPSATKAAVTPAADSFGVVHADQWKDIYPNEYASYEQNLSNSPEGKENYLVTKPEIKVIEAGYGYSKDYNAPASHLYTLETVQTTKRINASSKAYCITCKTPQFTALVQQQGESVFANSFASLIGEFDEPISCYNCHENDPTQLKVTQLNWQKVMATDMDKVPMSAQVCGQCHNDYSADPVTGVTTNPYTSLATMDPDDALKFYDDNNFVDWTYPVTGAKLIAVRHAEFEFHYTSDGGSHMTELGYTCSDCHMAATFAADGTAYSSHNWISPLDNDELIKRDCSKCHQDIKAEVKAWQSEGTAYTHQTGLRLADFDTNFSAAVTAGTLNDTQLARLQYIQRAADYYWNFVSAENSDTAHNPTLAKNTLDKSQKLMDEGDSILGVTSTAKELS